MCTLTVLATVIKWGVGQHMTEWYERRRIQGMVSGNVRVPPYCGEDRYTLETVPVVLEPVATLNWNGIRNAAH